MKIELTVVGVRNYCPGGEEGLPQFFAQYPIGTLLYLQVNPTGSQYPGALSVYTMDMQKIGSISKVERRFIKPMIPEGGMYPVIISGHSAEDRAILVLAESNLEFEEPYLRWIPLADGETSLPVLPEDERAQSLANMLRTQLRMLMAATPQLQEQGGEALLALAKGVLSTSIPALVTDTAQLLSAALITLRSYTAVCASSLDGSASFARGEVLLYLNLLAKIYPELKEHHRAILELHKDLNRNSGDVLLQTFRAQHERIAQSAYRCAEGASTTPMQDYLNRLRFTHAGVLTEEVISAEIQHLTQLLSREMYNRYPDYANDEMELARRLYSFNYQLPALYLLITRRLRLQYMQQLLGQCRDGVVDLTPPSLGNQPLATGADGVVVMYPHSHTSEAMSARTLCIALGPRHRNLLARAEQEEIIIYNNVREGFDVHPTATKALVSYLCGRLFCNDFSSEGEWIMGSQMDSVAELNRLFGFDVAKHRRSNKNRTGKVPVGYERVDRCFLPTTDSK